MPLKLNINYQYYLLIYKMFIINITFSIYTILSFVSANDSTKHASYPGSPFSELIFPTRNLKQPGKISRNPGFRFPSRNSDKFLGSDPEPRNSQFRVPEIFGLFPFFRHLAFFRYRKRVRTRNWYSGGKP